MASYRPSYNVTQRQEVNKYLQISQTCGLFEMLVMLRCGYKDSNNKFFKTKMTKGQLSVKFDQIITSLICMVD